MATDRRVVMRTSVLPTQTGTLEEYTAKSSHMVSTQGGRLGGTSKLTDITATQWGDGWTSFSSPLGYWEKQDDVWELNGETWSGELSISTTQLQLSADTSDLQFCYIKNLGSTAVIISLDANSTYPLKLSGGASTMFRGYSTNLKINEVYVKTSSGNSTVEYIIAK
jgi:hypothetical protein